MYKKQACVSACMYFTLRISTPAIIKHSKIVQQLTTQNQFYFLRKMNTLIFKILEDNSSSSAPFIIYGNFEGVLILSTDNINFGPKTKKYQVHNTAAN